jgi:hypothetical protein
MEPGSRRSYEEGMYHVNQRIDNLSDDMKQRFRIVNERLGAAA